MMLSAANRLGGGWANKKTTTGTTRMIHPRLASNTQDTPRCTHTHTHARAIFFFLILVLERLRQKEESARDELKTN